ncbi:hypothetical protein diail_1234 [Diaporthe ilicicola]|nr:hypothetical protein diail_1234 [Diaporthe ilicicola]
MSAPPTTRATRSRYSSPAVGGTGAGRRSSNDTSRDKDKESRDAASLDRSRQFMEAWIEPERVRLASFQEDGLVRQGVLETMEPLGTRPKPAMFRKLMGASSPFHVGGASGGREGSLGQDGGALTAGVRKNGGKRIVLKRKNGGVAANNSSNGRFDLSGTQSPTPSTAVATPQPSSTPAPELEPELEPEPEPREGAEGRTEADSEPEPGPALPPLQDSSPTPTASSAAAQHQASASIPSTSDIIQPESEDQPTSELTPTPQSHTLPASHSSPTPRRVFHSSHSPSHNAQPIPPSLPPLPQPALTTRSALFPPAYSSNPFLPDPVKQSIEDLPSFSSSHVPTTPRSVASLNDIDDTFFKRESSAQSASIFEMAPKARAHSAAPEQTNSAAQQSGPQRPAQHQPSDGPHYTASELERIIAQKDVVEKTFDIAVEEALQHYQYDAAYALRKLYEEYENNARFLLLAESVFRQTASSESLFQFLLYLNPKKAEGNKDMTAVKYFEAEARENKDYVPHLPEPAPYRDLITLDLSRLQDLVDNHRKRKRDEDNSADEATDESNSRREQALQSPGQPEVEPETAEVEPEPVATPPHPSKRQKLQTREPSTGRSAGRKTASASASASASRGMDGRANASPSRRKTRSGSVASDSSLSTAKSLSPPLSPPQEVDEDKQMQDVGDADAAAAAAAVVSNDAELPSSAGAPNPNGAGPGPGPELQPIAARPRRAPPRGRRQPIANAASESNANNASQQPAASNIPVSDAPGPGTQRSRNPRRGAPDFTPTQRLSDDDLTTSRRRAARETTHRLTTDARFKDDSHVRDEPMPGSLLREQSAQSDLSSLPDVEEPEPEPEPEPAAAAHAGRGARATRAAKRQHEDGEGDDAASTSPDFAPHAEPSTGVTSRATTPVRPAKRARTGPRLKVSPMKNKAGTAAGNPRARADRASPTMNGNPNAQVDNDDFCSACGGNGEIVCCDGCTRAFHQLCHDPFIPHSVLSDEDEEWYCWDCSIKRDPGLVKQHKGPWGSLMTALDKKHAVSYRLPKKVREYFEGVKTGADGEYEDFVAQPKGAKKQKPIEKSEFDFFQVVDKDSKPILPPNPNTFKCPCHIDGIQPFGRAHKFRKIRGQSEIHYAFSRGNVNNGYIEIADDPEPADHNSGYRDPSFGHTYVLSSGGVQADFLSKVRKHSKTVTKPVTKPRRLREEEAREKMKAALNLLQLRSSARKLGLDESLESASADELTAMMVATRQKYDKIVSELRKRDEGKHHDDLDSNAADADGPITRRVHLGRESQRRGDHPSTSARGDGHPNEDVANQDNVDMNGAGPQQHTASSGAASAPLSSDKTADHDDDSSVTQIVSNIVEAAVSSVVGKNATSATDTIASMAANVEERIDQEPTAQAAVDSALTPVSEAPKDGDDLTSAVTDIKPALSGIETPETEPNVPDQATSPAEAMELD